MTDGAPAIRVATVADVPAITALVNEVFAVEKTFKTGERTDEREVRGMFDHGTFLVVDHPAPAAGRPLGGAIFMELLPASDDPGRRLGYFGMLSVAPDLRGSGLARRLVADVERRSAEAGCHAVEIHVIDLRAELPAFYERLGYVRTGTMPYPDDGTLTKPCHFVVWQKPLPREGE